MALTATTAVIGGAGATYAWADADTWPTGRTFRTMPSPANAQKTDSASSGAAVIRLTFSGDHRLSFTAGCNNALGRGAVTNGHLVVREVTTTFKLCAAPTMTAESWFTELVNAGPSWSLRGRRLTLQTDSMAIRLVEESAGKPYQ